MTREQKLQIANTAPAWMYEFDLGDGIKTPLLDEELRSIHHTREQIIVASIQEYFFLASALPSWSDSQSHRYSGAKHRTSQNNPVALWIGPKPFGLRGGGFSRQSGA
jgi:hypothetical protein